MTSTAERMPLFPEWEQAHAQEIAQRESMPNRILVMWKIYGKWDAVTCQHCQHLLKSKHHNKTYYKCELYNVSRSETSDWRKKWKACGKYTSAAQPAGQAAEKEK